ncbi:hypothetical protein D9M72_498570 [compost metagenome]
MRTELAKRTARNAISPASTEPSVRYHLLTKPAVGGTPIMLSDATKNAPIVQGSRRPMPAMSLMFRFPEAQ